jgi:aconitate hydratase
VKADMFAADYASVFDGDENWRGLEVPTGDMFDWDVTSTYVRRPPYFDGMPREPEPLHDITGARVLVMLGDSITTDHISPAGAIKKESPAGRYLIEQGVSPKDFNSYGSRRGNHEVMIRGTFANIRLHNRLVPELEGGFSRHIPKGGPESIYEVAMQYAREKVPLLVIAGAEYGSGSSRDWAAKGTLLLGVKAVLATSFERIHRSNLIGMGVIPLQFKEGESAQSLGLTGEESYSITGLEIALSSSGANLPGEVIIHVSHDGRTREIAAIVRIDTPVEATYFRHGGILQYVLRQLLNA